VRRLVALTVLLVGASCASGSPPPAALDTASDTCRTCRMVVSDAHFAAQIVASGEEPIFFDDLGCLRDYLRQHPRPAGAAIYVADHRSGAWVPAASAIYTRLSGTATPMGGGMVAHADEASRRADSIAAGGTPLPTSAVVQGKEGRP